MPVFTREKRFWIFPKCSAAFLSLVDFYLLAILFDIIQNQEFFIVTNFPWATTQELVRTTAVSFLALFPVFRCSGGYNDFLMIPPNH